MCCPIFTKFGRYYFVQCCVGSTDFVAIGVGKAALLALAFNVKLFDILEVKNALKSIHSLADYPFAVILRVNFTTAFRSAYNFLSKFFSIRNLSVIPQTRCSSCCIATRLRTRRFGFRVPVDARELSLLQNVQTGCETHTATYSVCTRFLSRG